MEIKNVLVKDIKYAPYNPRKISDEVLSKLKRSIEEFGYIEPIVVNKRTMHVVGGNQRLKVLRQLGIEEVQAVIVDLDDTHEKALNIALNKINGEWDLPLLKDLLLEIDTGEIDIELTGFEMPEIEELMTQFHIEGEEDNFNVDEAVEEIKEPTTKTGDIWLLGKHRVMCGDSTIKEDVEKLMDGKKADMVFTDPPYGYEYRSNMRTKSKKFDVLLNDDKTLDFMPVIKGRCNGFVFICTTWKVLNKWLLLFSKYFDLSNMIIWDKGGGGVGDLEHTFLTDYEIILCSNNGAKITGKRIGCVWRIQKDNVNSYIHPTQKPVKLSAIAIENTTNTNNIVLDLFGGSGSTLIASEQLNRICYMMELDPVYCDVIVKRWEEYTGKKAELLEN
jgi:DNA modification methylase